MRKVVLAVLSLCGRRCMVCLLLAGGLGASVARADALNEALSELGYTRQSFTIDQQTMHVRSNAQYRLPMFDQWYGDPLRIPFWQRHLREGLLAGEGNSHVLFGVMAHWLGSSTRRDLIEPTPLQQYARRAAAPEALAQAIRALDTRAKVPSARRVPPVVQQQAAMLIFAAADALQWRELAMRKLPNGALPGLYAEISAEEDEQAQSKDSSRFARYASLYHHTEMLAQIDARAMNAAADDLTAVLDAAGEALREAQPAESYSFVCRTRYGVIALNSSADDRYLADTDYLLILDTGGNDHYQTGGCSRSAEMPLGLLIDVAGDDLYQALDARSAFGAGILGWGMLLDLAGNDRYFHPGFYTQGAARGGVGILCDWQGNDQYLAKGGAQGYGYFGIGLLADADGDDRYDTYCDSQGCGYTMGFGLLCDLQGNDRYTANDSDIIYPSSQTAEHNTSMSQGAGCGMRRDYIDGYSLAGGIGMLLDGAGDDVYFAGLYAQATSYWFSVGILDDRAGNDSYRGVWYDQSAAVHFGVSILVEGGGDDVYSAPMWCTLSTAHDFSVSLMLEEGGNDRYMQRHSALGQSLNSSLALFIDFAGDDEYQPGDAYGRGVNQSTSGVRAEVASTGIFLDLAGDDRYPNAPAQGNGKSWRQETPTPLPVLLGVGMDMDAGSVSW